MSMMNCASHRYNLKMGRVPDLATPNIRFVGTAVSTGTRLPGNWGEVDPTCAPRIVGGIAQPARPPESPDGPDVGGPDA